MSNGIVPVNGGKKHLPGQGPCTSGQILRKGYKTKKGVKVSPSCVKDQGAPGKGKKLFPAPQKGKLSKYGYHNIKNLSESERHKAISKAVKDHNPTTIVRDLNAIATLNKRTNPVVSEKMRSDAKWASNTFLK